MQLVIFDCDGVLIDSEAVSIACEAEAYNKVGLDISEPEFAVRFAGLPHDRIKELVEEELGRSLPEDFEDEKYRVFHERMALELTVIEGAHDVLDAIDYARCVCSNSSMWHLKTYLGKFDLYDRFRPYIFSAPEVREGRTKPEPDVFLHAAEELDVAPAECFVIEDSAFGVMGAKAAGMRPIGFVGASHTWLGHSDALMDAGAETVVRRLSEIPATLQALEHWREPVA